MTEQEIILTARMANVVEEARAARWQDPDLVGFRRFVNDLHVKARRLAKMRSRYHVYLAAKKKPAAPK